MSTIRDLEDLDLNRSINDAISQINNPRQRQSVQRAAYLLGASEDPGLSQDEINRELAIRACYAAINGEVAGPNITQAADDVVQSGL